DDPLLEVLDLVGAERVPLGVALAAPAALVELLAVVVEELGDRRGRAFGRRTLEHGPHVIERLLAAGEPVLREVLLGDERRAAALLRLLAPPLLDVLVRTLRRDVVEALERVQ